MWLKTIFPDVRNNLFTRHLHLHIFIICYEYACFLLAHVLFEVLLCYKEEEVNCMIMYIYVALLYESTVFIQHDRMLMYLLYEKRKVRMVAIG